MKLTQEFYQKKDSEARKILWEKGFKGLPSDLNSEIIWWIDQATDAYWRKRLYEILDNTTSPDAPKKWEGNPPIYKGFLK